MIYIYWLTFRFISQHYQSHKIIGNKYISNKICDESFAGHSFYNKVEISTWFIHYYTQVYPKYVLRNGNILKRILRNHFTKFSLIFVECRNLDHLSTIQSRRSLLLQYSNYPGFFIDLSHPRKQQHSFSSSPHRPIHPGNTASPGYPTNPAYTGTSSIPAAPAYPSAPGYATSVGYPSPLGYSSSPGYPASSGYPAYPGHSNSPGYPSSLGYSDNHGYPQSPGMQSVPGQAQPCGGSCISALGISPSQSTVGGGCLQQCNQNCYSFCPKKCCGGDKRAIVVRHKMAKKHRKHKKRTTIQQKKGKKVNYLKTTKQSKY